MRSLLGERFLKMFAGDLKNHPKHPLAIDEGGIPEEKVETGEGVERHSYDKCLGKKVAEPEDVPDHEG